MYRPTTLLLPAMVLCAIAFAGCAAETGEPASADSKPTHAKEAGTERTSEPAPVKQDKISYRTVRVKKSIPFGRNTVKTSTLDKGKVVVDRPGKPGVRVRVIRVKLKNGVEVGRELLNTVVKQRPVAQLKLVGTHVKPKPKPKPKPASNCDPNYTGACVPIASDVDCAGGSGDGPEYVQGPVRVVGDDIYDLNRDSDDIACDS